MIKSMILAAMVGFPPVDPFELHCMVEMLYYEARGETLHGKLAVANVTMNRVESERYPDSVCGVVHQKHQYSYYYDGQPENFDFKGHSDIEAFNEILSISLHVLNGWVLDNTEGALYYYAHDKVEPYWSRGKDKLIIGNHTFIK